MVGIEKKKNTGIGKVEFHKSIKGYILLNGKKSEKKFMQEIIGLVRYVEKNVMNIKDKYNVII